MNKIKILHVTGAMNRGGAEVMLMDIYRNISTTFQFDFLVNYKIKEGVVQGDFDDEIYANGARIKHIASQWDIGPLQYVKEFKKICKEVGKPDIVHIHMNAKSGIIALAAKNAGIKNIIVHSHADLKFRGSFGSRMASKLEFVFQKHLISMFANHFWGCSDEANSSLFYKRLLTVQSSTVIKNAIDLDAFIKPDEEAIQKLRESYAITSNTVVFGNVGRIVRHKNIGVLLDFFKKLKKENLDFVFVYAGRIADQVYYNEFLEKVKLYNLEGEMRYIGVRSDVPEVFHSFDVFLGPALQEGFGMVAVEAQAAGVPSLLYKGFPKTVDVNLDLTTFLADFQTDHWINAIKRRPEKLTNKALIKEKIIEMGFDVRSNVINIEKHYKMMLR